MISVQGPYTLSMVALPQSSGSSGKIILQGLKIWSSVFYSAREEIGHLSCMNAQK